MAKKCPDCGRNIEPWMKYCYSCHHKKKGDYDPSKLQKHHGGTK